MEEGLAKLRSCLCQALVLEGFACRVRSRRVAGVGRRFGLGSPVVSQASRVCSFVLLDLLIEGPLEILLHPCLLLYCMPPFHRRGSVEFLLSLIPCEEVLAMRTVQDLGESEELLGAIVLLLVEVVHCLKK